MVAINFPDSPTNGQEHAGYVWDATNNVWNRLPTLPALDLVNFSAVAPSNPQDGQFWFDTTVGKMYVYYNDGSSSQWVSAIGGLASQTGTTGQVLTYDGTEWVADDLPASGKILQVVSTSKTDTFSTSSSGFNDVTGLSATITPSSTSSKIFISLSAHTHTASSNNGANGALRLMRDSTIIAVGDAASGQAQTTTTTGYTGSNNFARSVNANFLDSPNTTSAVTYKVQMQSDGATAFLNRASGELANTNFQRSISSITVMEVAG